MGHNKCRDIALENTLFKIFTKILITKLQMTFDVRLSETQLRFRKGRSLVTAVDLLLANIWEALVFIGFTKAFHLINKKLGKKKQEETNKNNLRTQTITAVTLLY